VRDQLVGIEHLGLRYGERGHRDDGERDDGESGARAQLRDLSASHEEADAPQQQEHRDDVGTDANRELESTLCDVGRDRAGTAEHGDEQRDGKGRDENTREIALRPVIEPGRAGRF